MLLRSLLKQVRTPAHVFFDACLCCCNLVGRFSSSGNLGVVAPFVLPGDALVLQSLTQNASHKACNSCTGDDTSIKSMRLLLAGGGEVRRQQRVW